MDCLGADEGRPDVTMIGVGATWPGSTGTASRQAFRPTPTRCPDLAADRASALARQPERGRQYPFPVADDGDLTIKLTKDQAFVLSDWLYRMMGTPPFDNLVNEDRAVWSPLHAITGTLDKSLVEVFMPDYTDRLQRARERLLDSLGDIGKAPSSP